ncbi:carotenoid oxygenase family protein [Streptosporangium sp. NPDC051023]|uniref:carotenoid oxygenase family protein n=1 Tax=Streptosporangium sp. NPDC051023 TaxID=3155410 RepID=UPI00344C6E1D
MAAPARASDQTSVRVSPAVGRPPSPERLPVEGVLPADLDGWFLQAFPHPLCAGRPDGRSVLSGVRVSGGSALLHRVRATARQETPLGPVPALAPPIRLASTKAPAPCSPGHVTLARPVCDPATGEWHTVAAYPGLGHVEHLVTGSGGTVSHARPFALDGAPLMHATALTERYVVVFDLPVVYSRAAELVGARLPYAWRPDRRARLGLLPRDGAAEPRWFQIGPCYVFQAVNAYEEGGRVVVDAVRHPRAFDAAPGDAVPDGAPPGFGARPYLCRWTLDLTTGTVGERALAPAWETALVDEGVLGRRHRYVFGSRDLNTGTTLFRRDLVTGGVHGYELGAGIRAGHPVFVPRPVGSAREGHEGDGWIVVLSHDAAGRRSELLVFDALDLAGGPYATVRVPRPPLACATPASGRATWLPA